MSTIKDLLLYGIICSLIGLGTLQILSIADSAVGYQDLICQEGC